MVPDIKRTKEDTKEELKQRLEFAYAVKSWNQFIIWLAEQDKEQKLLDCMEYEIANACRPQFIDRLRTRYNKIRAYNELKALEARIGKVINVNHV
jgi:hypothetical protein